MRPVKLKPGPSAECRCCDSVTQGAIEHVTACVPKLRNVRVARRQPFTPTTSLSNQGWSFACV